MERQQQQRPRIRATGGGRQQGARNKIMIFGCKLSDIVVDDCAKCVTDFDDELVVWCCLHGCIQNGRGLRMMFSKQIELYATGLQLVF